jgi:hypothetical protein
MKRAAIVVVMLVVLAYGMPAFSQGGDILPDCFCFEDRDATGRALSRALCDSLAEANGYNHGVLIPDHSCRPGDDPVFCVEYECYYPSAGIIKVCSLGNTNFCYGMPRGGS